MPRKKFDIMRDILDAAGEGSSKRELFRNVGLNYKTLNKYLSILKEKKFLNESNGNYKTNGRGHEFSKIYSDLKELLKEN